MTAGKNPRNFKKKGNKKAKVGHPFARKEWYNVLAPGFDKRCITLTPCNKSAG
jgi:ribosomal protein S3AE